METSSTRRKFNYVPWLLLLTLAALLVVPRVTRRGIFLDGLVYATISRNLALGIGDPLHLYYTGAINEFRDSPPLAFCLESVAFRLLGDHWWVEKLYSLLTAAVTGGIILATWRWLTRVKPELQGMAWLPLAMWIMLPCWQWTVVNNMLENTMSIFTAAAVYCALRSFASQKRPLVWIMAAAAAVVAAALTKGPVGLFPLAAPLCAASAFPQQRQRTIWLQVVLPLIVVGGLVGLLLNADCYEYFRVYWQQQVVASLRGERETHPSVIGQAHILWSVFTNLLLAMSVAGGLVWWARRREIQSSHLPELRQAALFCLLMGLAGSCPVAISPKQTGFYVTPSYPFYVLAIALWCVEAIDALRTSISPATLATLQRRLTGGAAIALVLLLGYSLSFFGKPRRDLRDFAIVGAITSVVPAHTAVDVPPAVSEEWSLLGYLQRDHFISLEPVNAEREFRLELKNGGATPAGYVEVALDMPRYRLLRRAEVSRAAYLRPEVLQADHGSGSKLR
jgi:4-amino-4-deoxy-L-arabinose transferase-like glycosyltransferase